MDKTFNELFNEFFKRNDINPDEKLTEEQKINAKQMLDLLAKGGDNPKIDEEQEKEMDAELGKPDKIEFFNEGDTFFERRIWHTPTGDIQKLSFSKDPSLIIAPQPKNLQKELEAAVENEEFEKAIAIRDEIKKSKKVTKKAK
jgi:hypothetical protein